MLEVKTALAASIYMSMIFGHTLKIQRIVVHMRSPQSTENTLTNAGNSTSDGKHRCSVFGAAPFRGERSRHTKITDPASQVSAHLFPQPSPKIGTTKTARLPVEVAAGGAFGSRFVEGSLTVHHFQPHL
jgi:hypothetical protein